MIRRSAYLLRGRISSMLELGGASSAHTKQEKNIIDTSKNNKVRACILDFDLLIRNTNLTNDTKVKTNVTTASSASSMSRIIPDAEKIKNVASLLNVELGSTMKLSKLEREQNDDLSGLGVMAESKKIVDSYNNKPNQYITKNYDTINMKAPPVSDVRSKYASKMRSKLDQGYNPNTTDDGTIARGDAKDLLLARSIVMSNNKSSSKWIAGTDTGKLLNYLSSRSMKIALIPSKPKISNSDDNEDSTYQRMLDLTNQLPNVNFHVLLKSSTASSSSKMLDAVLSKLNDDISTIINPLNILVVSDKDDILSAAKEMGMFSCRVRLNKSSPRGNISVNYNKDNVAEVQDVIDDINGISFNTVLSGR